MLTAPARPDRRSVPPWAYLAICCLAQFMVVLDVSIVNVALPQMRTDLGLSPAGQQWVVNAYTLTFAGLLLLGGRAADLFGRRRVFIAGLVLFTTCSLLGGLAQDSAWLIAARAAQGAGAAILAPATLSLLTTRFPEGDERQRALGAWSATAAAGAAIGVLLGGVLTSALDWRWVLFVNVPVGIVLVVGAGAAITESRSSGPRRRLDLLGAVTVTLGLATTVYAIVGTNTHPWGSARTLATLVVGIAILVTFVVIEARLARNPLVPLRVFRRRSLTAANGISAAMGVALTGTFFFLALFLQQIDGYSPVLNGVAALPSAVGTVVGSRLSPHLVRTLGARRQLVLGLIVAAGGLVWLSSSLHPGASFWTDVFVPTLLVGLGLGTSFVPVTVAATSGLPSEEAGLASGLLTTSRQMGGAVGLAAMATVAAHLAGSHGPGLAAAHAAAAHGYDIAFLIAAGVLAAGALLAPRPTRS